MTVRPSTRAKMKNEGAISKRLEQYESKYVMYFQLELSLTLSFLQIFFFRLERSDASHNSGCVNVG
jgi:hypothetical protein